MCSVHRYMVVTHPYTLFTGRKIYPSAMWVSASGGCGRITCCEATRCQTVRLDLTLHRGTGWVMVRQSDLLGDDGIRNSTSLFHSDLPGGGIYIHVSHDGLGGRTLLKNRAHTSLVLHVSNVAHPQRSRELNFCLGGGV